MGNRVRYYTKGVDKTIVNFPEDNVCCGNCHLLMKRTDNRLTRYACSRTLEPLGDIYRTIGNCCPLEILVPEDKNEH